MKPKLDPDLEKILPLLPLRDAATLTPARARAELVALAESRKDVPLPELASVKDIIVDGAADPIAARLYAPGKTPAPTVVYFHGGGWVAGDLFTHERQARTLALELEAVVVSVDYRRPPETPFPGAFEDCLAATRWAAANVATLGGDVAHIVVAGDRGGGEREVSVAPGQCRGILPDRRCHALLCRPLPSPSAGQRGPARLAAALRHACRVAARRHLHRGVRSAA